jgi:multisubunit Na+/H+ antiporter MnhG subunit
VLILKNVFPIKKLNGVLRMGFYYLLILFIGVVLLVVGTFKWVVSRSVKNVIYLFVFGILLIAISLFLLTPVSSDIIYNIMH